MKALTIIFFIMFQFLPVNVFSSSMKEDYDLQERCGKRCEEYFKNNYSVRYTREDGAVVTTYYENHYNSKRNKCFILIVSDDGNVIRKELLDVNENRSYGIIRIRYGSNIPLCYFLDERCKSEEEWDLLVKPFMEE